MRILLITALLLFTALPAWCDPVKITANEIHESSGNNIVKGFVEDVISLLPPEFRKDLDSQTIQSSVRFNNNRSKFNYSTMSEKDLYSIYARLSKRYTNKTIGSIALSDELGSTVSAIIEAAMTSGSADLLGDKFSANMENFFKEEYKTTHVIKYDGYNSCDLRSCISQIYDLARHKKATVYPLMVTRTADLWTAVYNSMAKNTEIMAKTIVRRPMDVSYGSRKNDSRAFAKNMNLPAASRSNYPGNSARSNSLDDEMGPDTAIIILVPVR